MTLEQFILDYIRQHRSVTFSELSVAGGSAGYPMKGDLELGNEGEENGYFWCCMSREFAEAVRNLLYRGEIRIVPTSALDIMTSSPTVLVSKQPPIPCRLEAMEVVAT